jgi:hypothetical protein
VGEGQAIVKAPDLRARWAVLPQCGVIKGDQPLHAKRHRYKTLALVVGDTELGARFDDRQFAHKDKSFGHASIREGASSAYFESCFRDCARL